MRKIDRAYKEREDDRMVNDNQAFNPPNANKVVTETDSVLREIGEGESIIKDKDSVLTEYVKVNGKLFMKNTTLTEV